MIWSWPRAARQRQSTELREALRHSGRAFCGLMGECNSRTARHGLYRGVQGECWPERGVPVLRFPCTGFESAPVGRGPGLRNLALGGARRGVTNQRISILGYSDLALGSRQPLRLGAEGFDQPGGIRSVSGGRKVLGAESSGLRRP
mgnify:CR=1 FL=1